ncbi:hypothetical protein ACFC0M_00145 [Streptomyces sp. NPDC056149]|uniref:terpene synthase family protein n=1 Tax=Streptomyces sp. NPDC056149 TaxID=3345728 RepID=UPI0035DF77BF
MSCPNITVPFPLRINAHLATARQRDLDWAGRAGLMSTPHDERRYRSWDIALLVAGWLPDAPADGLELAANAFNWCTIYDDLHVGEKSTNSRYARSVGEPLLTYLETGVVPADASPFLLALHDVITREKELYPTEHHARLTQNWAVFLSSTMEETGNRANRKPLSYREYRDFRRKTGAVHLMTDLIEVANGYHTTAELRAVPAFRSLFDSANDAICYINDLYSQTKEEAAGDHHNLVFVFERELGCTRQEAVERTVEAVLEACDNMLLQRSRMRTACRRSGLTPEETACAFRFAHDIMYPISSMVSWQQKSARYTRPDNTPYTSVLQTSGAPRTDS